jgi:hypothetical protein
VKDVVAGFLVVEDHHDGTLRSCPGKGVLLIGDAERDEFPAPQRFQLSAEMQDMAQLIEDRPFPAGTAFVGEGVFLILRKSAWKTTPIVRSPPPNMPISSP